jgi:hypothetical protein
MRIFKSFPLLATVAAAAALVLVVVAACGGEKTTSKKSSKDGGGETVVTLTFDAYGDKSAEAFKVYVQNDASAKAGLDTDSGTSSGTSTSTATSKDAAGGSSAWTLVKSFSNTAAGFDAKSPSVTLTPSTDTALKDFMGKKVCFAVSAYGEDAESEKSKPVCTEL